MKVAGARPEPVRGAGGNLVGVWLREHLREPRFDDKFARMPAFSLSPADLDGVVAYLLTLE